MKYPKVLVFTPIYDKKDYCLDKFVEHADKLLYPNYNHIFIDNTNDGGVYAEKLKAKGLDVAHIDRGKTTREALARAQKFARKFAIKEDYDYMLSLESDIMIKPDTIHRLMAWGKDVITALYLIGNDDIKIPCITLPKYSKELGAWGTRLLKPEEIPQYMNQGLRQVQAGGMGCCLIHKNVFKKIDFYFDPRFRSHSDVYFFNHCWENKIGSYVDTGVYLDHDNSDWTKVEDR